MIKLKIILLLLLLIMSELYIYEEDPNEDYNIIIPNNSHAVNTTHTHLTPDVNKTHTQPTPDVNTAHTHGVNMNPKNIECNMK